MRLCQRSCARVHTHPNRIDPISGKHQRPVAGPNRPGRRGSGGRALEQIRIACVHRSTAYPSSHWGSKGFRPFKGNLGVPQIYLMGGRVGTKTHLIASHCVGHLPRWNQRSTSVVNAYIQSRSALSTGRTEAYRDSGQCQGHVMPMNIRRTPAVETDSQFTSAVANQEKKNG